MLARSYWHKSLTDDAITNAVEADDYLGFCLMCGCEAEGCEPDARNCTCESCGAEQVFGAKELLLMVA